MLDLIFQCVFGYRTVFQSGRKVNQCALKKQWTSTKNFGRKKRRSSRSAWVTGGMGAAKPPSCSHAHTTASSADASYSPTSLLLPESSFHPTPRKVQFSQIRISLISAHRQRGQISGGEGVGVCTAVLCSLSFLDCCAVFFIKGWYRSEVLRSFFHPPCTKEHSHLELYYAKTFDILPRKFR